MKKSLFFLFCTFLYFSVSAQILTGPSGAGRQEQFFKALKGSFPALVSDTTAAKANGYFPENATNGNREGMLIRYTADFKLYELIKDGSSYYWKPVGATTIDPDQFIRNGTTSQTANFNITGTGQGGILRGNTRLEAGVDWWLVGNSGAFSLQYPGGSRTPISVSSGGVTTLDGGLSLINGNLSMNMDGSGTPRHIQLSNFTGATHAGTVNDSLLTYDPVSTRVRRIAFSIPWSKITGTPGFEPAIAAGTTAQYWRGDKTWQTLNTTAVPEGTNLYWTNARGDARYPLLSGSYVNPSWLASLPWSKITDAPGFEPTIAAGTTAQYWRGDKTWQTLNTTVVPEGTNLYWTNARGDARYPQLTGSYANPTWLTSLAWAKITGAPSSFPTTSDLQTVTDNGNTTTNSITFPAAATGIEWRNSASIRWLMRQDIFPNSDFSLYKYDDAGVAFTVLRAARATGIVDFSLSPTRAGNTIWDANNHVTGSAFTPTLTGANVPASFTSNAAGHVTAFTTRALTAADIGAAAATGSGNYIQNNGTATPQTASFNINGNAAVQKDGSNAVNGTFIMYNAARSRGANIQLNGDATPGLSILIHNGSAWTERTRISATTGEMIVFGENAEGISVSRAVSTGGVATGGIRFNALNAASTPTTYARIWGVISGNTAGAHNGSLAFNTFNAGTEATRMTLTNLGNLLVGGSSDNTTDRIQVTGSIAATGAVKSNNGTVNTQISPNATTSGQIGTTTNHHLDIFTNATTRGRVEAGGNWLIGAVTTAGAKLDVRGDVVSSQAPALGAARTYMQYTTGGGYIKGETHNGTSWVAGDITLDGNTNVNGMANITSTITAPVLQSPSGDNLLLLANGAPTGSQVTLTNDGMGIGGMPGGTHTAKLLVAGNAVSTDAWVLDGGGVSAEFFLDGGTGAGVRTISNHPLRLYSNNTERMALNAAGQIEMKAGIVEKTTSSTSTAYAVVATDHVIKLDPAGTGGTGTITLPNPATSEGRELKIIAVDGATYTSNFSITQPTSLGPPTTSIQGVFIIQAIAGTWYLISKL